LVLSNHTLFSRFFIVLDVFDPLRALLEDCHVSNPSGAQLATNETAAANATIGVDFFATALLVAAGTLRRTRAFLIPSDADCAHGEGRLFPVFDLGTRVDRERLVERQRQIAIHCPDRFQRWTCSHCFQ
jgi:hypothetical protein